RAPCVARRRPPPCKSLPRPSYDAPLARQGEVEGGALVHDALGPDPASMSLDDALHQGQADPRTFKLVRAVHTIEHLEELARVRHVEPDAVVSDEVDSLGPLEARGDFHAGVQSGAAELEGV